MIRLIFIFTLIILLSGCQMFHRNVYYIDHAETLGDKAATLLEHPDKGGWRRTWRTGVSSYQKFNDEDLSPSVNVVNIIFGHPTIVKLPEGIYRFRFYCSTGGGYANPAIDFEAKQGRTYYARCFSAGDNQVIIEIQEAELEPAG